MDFGCAVRDLKDGLRVTRPGWNGQGMFLYLSPASQFPADSQPTLSGTYAPGTVLSFQACVIMRTAGGSHVPWLASQTDILAEDWEAA